MRIEYDPTHDLLNIEFIPEEPIVNSVELDGVIIDYSSDGRIVSLEILDAGKRTTKGPLDLLDLTIVKREQSHSIRPSTSLAWVSTLFTATGIKSNDGGENLLRFCFAKEDAVLDEACRRLEHLKTPISPVSLKPQVPCDKVITGK